MPIIEKTKDSIPRKRPDRRTEGLTDRPYFNRTLPADAQRDLVTHCSVNMPDQFCRFV